MTNINELKSVQTNIINFYTNFIKKKRINKKDLMNLYLKDKLAKSILLLNLKSELNNLEKAQNYLLQVFTYERKKDISTAIKENRKDFPEISEAILSAFKILSKMKYYNIKILKTLKREIANINNKEKLEKIYKNEEIPLLIKLSERTELWNKLYNQCGARLKNNKQLSILQKRASERGEANVAFLISLVIAIASGIITYHQIIKPGIDIGSDAIFVIQTMSKDGLLSGLIGLITLSLTIWQARK